MSTLLEPAAPPALGSRTCCAMQNTLQAKTRSRHHLTAAADLMENARLHVIAHALRFTAAQEQEHAVILRGMMHAQGWAALPDAEDAALPHDPLLLIRRFAQASETARANCTTHARIALEEGWPRIAHTLLRIAETDARHARRFRQYEAALAENTLFRDVQRITWLCLHCGELHTGQEPPLACPGCGKDQGHFIRSSYFPFHAEG